MPRQHRLPRTTRRGQLLDVALPLFGSRGFHDTSMDDIAEAAGVTKPVLYQHFSSKAELYRELLTSVGEDVMRLITDDAARQADPQRRVKAGFVAYFGWVRDHTSAFNLLFGGSARQEDGSAEVVAAIEDRMAAAVGQFIEAGVDGPHQELLGYAIVGLAEITARQWVARNGGLATSQATPLDAGEGELLAQRLGDLVWAGLRGLPDNRAAESLRAEAAALGTGE